MDKDSIRSIIRKELNSLIEAKMPVTREGSPVEYACEDHIMSLEADLVELISIRDRSSRRSTGRWALSRAVERVRTELKRAKRIKSKKEQRLALED